MESNRFFVVLLASTFAVTGFSGCFADDGAPSATSPGTSASTATMTLTKASGPNGTTSSSDASAEPPTANFTVAPANASQVNLTAGADLLFNASASDDPEGGALTYLWDFGDNATGEGVVTNHTFAKADNYTVNLTVTSDESGLNASTQQVLVIVSGAPAMVTFADPTGDAKANYLDLKSGKITDDGTVLILTIGLAAMCPCNAADTLFMTHVNVGALEFEVYNYGAGSSYKVWDVTNGAAVPGSAARIAGTGWEIKIPLEYLAGKKVVAPYAVFAATFIGEGAAGGVEGDDRMPNAGTVAYG
jgi:chitodextrinase